MPLRRLPRCSVGDVLGFRQPGFSRSREDSLAESGLHPWEAAGARHCGATFHTSEKVYACPLAADHAGEHSGEPNAGRWYWSDGDRFIRLQR
jgi:hypothetical protein